MIKILKFSPSVDVIEKYILYLIFRILPYKIQKKRIEKHYLTIKIWSKDTRIIGKGTDSQLDKI